MILAIAIIGLGVVLDMTLTKIFAKSYWQLPREKFFFFIWPIIALLLSLIFYKYFKNNIWGCAMLISFSIPVVAISVWFLIWGNYMIFLGIIMMVGLVLYYWKKKIMNSKY